MQPTINILDGVGSIVYESAIVVMGLEEGISRSLLSGKLASLGIAPADLDIECLCSFMPQIESMLLLALKPGESVAVMTRLNSLILNWQEIPVASDVPTSGRTDSARSQAQDPWIEWK